MPQIPILIPVIITGLVVGSMLKSKRKSLSAKRLLLASVVSGLLNAVYGYSLFLLTPTTTFITGGTFTGTLPTGTFLVRQASETEFTISSFLAGFLIVLVVVGIAIVYARGRKGEEEEMEAVPELTAKEESELKTG